jgi:HPt (histidine-containing phosphotransfer) domain-containing protein
MSEDHRPDETRRESPLISSFAHDDHMAGVVETFLDQVQERIDALRDAFEIGEDDTVRAVLGEIRGGGSGCGFPDIAACAAEMQHALDAGEAEASAVSEQLEELINLCRRATY